MVRAAMSSLLLSLLVLGTPASVVNRPKPEEIRLLNGLRILVWRTDAPVVRMRLRIHSGAAFDPRGKEGTMAVLSQVLFPDEQLREFFREDLGGNFFVTYDYDTIQVEASAKPERLLDMLETVANGVINAEITKEATAGLKNLQSGEAAGDLGVRKYAANQGAAEALVGNYPLGRSVLGTPESISRIDFADLIQAKQRFVHAGNATIAIDGKVDIDLVSKAMKRLFGGWVRADETVQPTFAQPAAPAAGIIRVPSKLASDGTVDLRLAFRTVAANAPNAAAVRLAGEILRRRIVDAFGQTGVFTVRGRRLPALWIFGLDGVADESAFGKLDALMAKEVSADELRAALAELLAVASSEDMTAVIEARLDIDTLGLPSGYDEATRLNQTTLEEVRTSLVALRGNPHVRLVFGAPKTSDEVNRD
jgi:predicted Zn-dependent peptidase